MLSLVECGSCRCAVCLPLEYWHGSTPWLVVLVQACTAVLRLGGRTVGITMHFWLLLVAGRVESQVVTFLGCRWGQDGHAECLHMASLSTQWCGDELLQLCLRPWCSFCLCWQCEFYSKRGEEERKEVKAGSTRTKMRARQDKMGAGGDEQNSVSSALIWAWHDLSSHREKGGITTAHQHSIFSQKPVLKYKEST